MHSWLQRNELGPFGPTSGLSRFWQSLLVLGFLMISITFSLVACGPVGKVKKPGFCEQSSDCGASEACQNNVCIVTASTSTEMRLPWEGITYPDSGGLSDENSILDSGSECSGDQTSPSCDTGLKGHCAIGTKKCQNGTWGPCVSKSSHNPEICDGKDNDCDGQIDNNTGQEEYSLTRPYYTKIDGTPEEGSPGVGECRNGQLKCSEGKWKVAYLPIAPKKEVCNGKDDNCDGVPDAMVLPSGKIQPITQPCYDGPNGTANVGFCKKGTRICQGGNWSSTCQNQTKPTSEVCDGKDNDCDGQIDEPCAPYHNYAIIEKGSASKIKGFSYRHLSAGKHKLIPTKAPSQQGNCGEQILILTAQSSKIVSTSYTCKSEETTQNSVLTLFTREFQQIVPFHPTFQAADVSLHVISPQTGAMGTCRARACRTKVNIKAKIDEQKKRLILTGSSCSQGQPIFATMINNKPGFVRTRVLGDKSKGFRCEIQTLDSKGTAFLSSVAFWLPEKEKDIWAQISEGNKKTVITAQTNNRLISKKWHANQTRAPSIGKPLLYELSFDSWIEPSLIVLTPQFILGPISKQAYGYSVTFKRIANGKIKIYTKKLGIPSSDLILSPQYNILLARTK